VKLRNFLKNGRSRHEGSLEIRSVGGERSGVGWHDRFAGEGGRDDGEEWACDEEFYVRDEEFYARDKE
jgi:hypothetical protein